MTVSTQREIFVRCQDNVACHESLCKALSKMFTETDFDAFWKDFLHHVKHVFVFLKREPAVERMVEFVVKFIAKVAKGEEEKENSGTEESKGEILMNKFFNFLIQYHDYEDSVRFRCCLFMSKLLSSLSDDAEIDEDLFEAISKAMMERISDRIAAVRVQAVLALSRFQDPHDKDCPIVTALLKAFCDPNFEVRKAVISTLIPSPITLAEILKRTRDEDSRVRVQTYKIVAEKVHIKALSISERIKLLQDGLNDKDKNVREMCSNKLLQAWMVNANILDLLHCLDVEMSVPVCKQVTDALFSQLSVTNIVENFDQLNEKKLIDTEKLTAANSFYWFSVGDYLHKKQPITVDEFEDFMPDPMQFADYITQYAKVIEENYTPDSGGNSTEDEDALIQHMERIFICEQLIHITALFDTIDEAVKNRLKTLYQHLMSLTAIDHSLMEHIVPKLLRLFTNESAASLFIAETISDIREPITTVEVVADVEEQRRINLQMAAVRLNINQAREDLDTAVAEQNFSRAAEVKEKIEELETERDNLAQALVPQSQEIRSEKTDPVTLTKCLAIVKELLVHGTMTSLDATIHTIADTLIVPCILRIEIRLRNYAIMCLGLVSLLSRPFAVEYFALLIQVTQVDVETIRISGLKALFDILLLHGLTILEEDGDADKTETQGKDGSIDESNEQEQPDKQKVTEDTILVLVSILDSESVDMRTIAAEGLCKLLVCERIASYKIFSRLVLLWYNPLSEDDVRLRHCLAQFFPLYAQKGTDQQDIIQQAFMLSLAAVFDAPASSPLSLVDVDHLIAFYTGLTSAKLLAESRSLPANMFNEHTIHNDIAVTIANKIITHPQAISVRYLAKALKGLDLNISNTQQIKDLQSLTAQTLQLVKDKAALKTLETFHAHVTSLISKSTDNTEKDGDTGDDTLVESIADTTQSAVENGNSVTESEVFADVNPADLYRTILENASNKTAVNASILKSISSDETRVSDTDITKDRDQLREIENRLSTSVRVSDI